jgi:hypothetical protein
MAMHTATQPVDVSTTRPRDRDRIARNVLLGLAVVWFLIQALPTSFDGDPTLALMGLVQRLGPWVSHSSREH